MLIYSLHRIEKPKILPISIEEAKIYLKIDNNLEDQLIEDIIEAVVGHFENITSIAIAPQIWEIIYKYVDNSFIELPINPVSNIINIQWLDCNLEKCGPRPKYKIIGNTIALESIALQEALLIKFKAGRINDQYFIPANIKLILLDHAAFLYENRGTNKQFNLNVYNQFRNIKY